MYAMVKELLEMLEKGKVITKEILEVAYETHQRWEVCQDDNLEYSSKVYSEDELREEAITNEWENEGVIESMDTESLVHLFENYGFTVWRV